MFRQMVWAGKPFVANFALVRFDARMGPFVPGQFIRAWKSPPTSLPRALERFFPCVTSKVGLKVWAFAVHLVAPGISAVVNLVVCFLFQSRRRRERWRAWWRHQWHGRWWRRRWGWRTWQRCQWECWRFRRGPRGGNLHRADIHLHTIQHVDVRQQGPANLPRPSSPIVSRRRSDGSNRRVRRISLPSVRLL